MTYFIAGCIGFFVGVVVTCFLLSKKNLETYYKYTNKASDSLKNNVALAKGAYKAYMKEYEEGLNGSDNTSSEEYQNGTMGTVTRCDTDFVLVKVDDRKDFGGKVIKGKTVTVERHAFCKYKYESKTHEILLFEENSSGEKTPVIDEKTGLPKTKREITLDKIEVGRAEQFPLRLGYAVTIHKSQGQTYEALNLSPEIFSTGMLYVALSRCKTIENIHVEGSLTNRMVMSSPEVLAFYSNPEGYSFFGDGIATIHVPEKYKDKILALIQEWESGNVNAGMEAEAKAETATQPQKRGWGGAALCSRVIQLTSNK